MNRTVFFALTLLIFPLLGACGPLATPAVDLPFVITLTHTAAIGSPIPAQKLAIETELSAPTQMAEQVVTPTAIQSGSTATTSAATAEAVTPAVPSTYIPYQPAPTETLLPQLDLPTEQPRAPALVAWTGLPTYPGDSDPGRLFRMDYDPDIWAQTEGLFGDIVLGNRRIDYCTITPWTGRGLPMDWKVTHEFRIIGSAAFDVNTVTVQDMVKFVSYVGGDTHLLTGFQVSFNEQQEQCLQDAEAIFGTLRAFASVPTATPTLLPETPTPSVTATGAAPTP